MGSIVELNCKTCGYSSGNLSVGWGRAGRTREECQGALQLLEGLAQDIPCPSCNTVLRTTNLGVWN
jgi:hypothetical protein